MKKKLISLIIILMVGFYNMSPIYANSDKGESAGGGGGNSADIPVSDKSAKWFWSAGYNGSQGLKISVYKKDGSLVGTKAFVNSKTEEQSLNKNGVMVKQGETKRLSLSIEKGSWKKSDNGYFQYLDYSDYVNKSTYLDIVKMLKGVDEKELVQKLGVDTYSNTEKKNLVLVIEPATTFYSAVESRFYFGTYWEFMWMNNNLTGKLDFRWQFNNWFFNGASDKNIFSKNLKIKKGEISPDKTEVIWAFLETKFTAFRSKVEKEDSLGVAIITLGDVIDVSTDLPCNTTVIKGSCDTDYEIKEPTEQACVVNNDVYKYQAITECGIVYCSQNIATDLDDFNKKFDPIIKSGGYFNMNPIKMKITKTCYLKASNNNSSCNNWQTMIREEDAGNIKLSLVSDYNLMKDSNKSTFTSVCNSKSGNKCTKATVTQYIEYILEPTTNRYISIKDMAGTATSPGDDVTDLGSANLTTPITFASGTHNYSLDFTSTPLFKTKDRLVKDTIDSADGNYTLNYSYSKELNNVDFSYSCPYTAQNPSGCLCTDECCDNECKPIPCDNPDEKPGGFPNVIYRPINLEDAFPGEDGTGRDYGSNWKDYVYDDAGNIITKPNGTPYTKEEYYINFNRGYDNYEVYRTEPLYVIKLDYDIMKAIRQYNDDTNHDYNDFTLTCNNGENCISNFLRGNVRGFNINLIHSGTCKTINHSTFNSCILRK